MFQSWNILNECCCYRSCFILKWKVPIINAGTAEKAGSDRYIQRMTEDPRGTNHGLRWWDPPRISRWYHGMSWLQFLAQGGGSVRLAAGFPNGESCIFSRKIHPGNSNPLESAPNSRFFAQWTCRNYLGLEESQSCRSENGCPTVVRATFRETCNGWWASFASNGIASTLGVEWRQPYCRCTAAKDSCRICVFFVVSRKWQSCHMGQSRPWWWQLFGVLEEIDLWHGVIQNTVVTAPESKISYGMFSRFVVHLVLLLQFWRTEPSWHGALDIFSAQDSSSVQDHLKNVQHISGTARAFAAILADGSVLTWGDPHYGGDSSRRMSSRSVAQSVLSKFVRAGERRGCEEVGPSDHWRRKVPNMFDSLVVQLSKNQPEALLPFDLLQAVPQLPFWQMEAWWHGAMDVMVVAAPESKISCKMLCRSVAQMTGQMNVIVLSLPFWQMDKSWAGAIEKTAIDALVTTRTASNRSSTTFRCLWENPGDASSGLTPLKSIEYWPILVDVQFFFYWFNMVKLDLSYSSWLSMYVPLDFLTVAVWMPICAFDMSQMIDEPCLAPRIWEGQGWDLRAAGNY